MKLGELIALVREGQRPGRLILFDATQEVNAEVIDDVPPFDEEAFQRALHGGEL